MRGEGKIVPVYATKAYVGVEEYLHSFLKSDLYRDGRSASGSCQSSTRGGEEAPPPTHWI